MVASLKNVFVGICIIRARKKADIKSTQRHLSKNVWYTVRLVLRNCSEPEFRDVTRRLKRYIFAKRYLSRGQAAQQGFPLFSFRVVGKIYLVHFHKTTLKKIALSYSLNCFDICKYFKHITFFSFYEKESYNMTIIPS